LFGAGYLIMMSVEVVGAVVLPSIAHSAPGYVTDVLAVATAGHAAGDIGLMQPLISVMGIGYLSERQFTRVFKSEVGVTAADHVEAVRRESACRPFETTNRTIEQIAKTCGFGTPETMNRTSRRRLNTTPGDHRHHFRGDIFVPRP